MDFSKRKNNNYNKGKKAETNKDPNTEEKKEQKDILDYFIIGDEENENNVEVNSDALKNPKMAQKENEENKNDKKIYYNVQSFITSNVRPDIYSPLGIIGGNKYNLMKIPNKQEENEEIGSEEKLEENDEEIEEEKGEEEEKESEIIDKKEDNEKKNLDNYKLLKSGRYYVLDDDITVKCHNCGEVGHVKDLCPYNNLKFCHRCLSLAHNDKDCKNKKCFRCNKSGHNKNECELKDCDIMICFNCQNSGHRKNECLINPVKIDQKFIKNNGLSCFYCGSPNHLICPLSKRENVELLKETSVNFDQDCEDMENSNSQEISSETPIEEEDDIIVKKEYKLKKNKTKQIFDDLKNGDIKFTIFCGYCGDRHRNEECPLKDDPKFFNEFDSYRKNICKKILDKRQKEKEEEEKSNSLLKKRKREISNKNYNSIDNQNKNKNKVKGNNFLNMFYNNDNNNTKEYLSLREDEDDEFAKNKFHKKAKNKKNKNNMKVHK